MSDNQVIVPEVFVRCPKCVGGQVGENDDGVVHYYDCPNCRAVGFIPAPAPGVCVWSENEDGQWDTTCGACWEFMNEGTPADNGVVYCHKCGNHVEAKPYTEKEATE